MAQEIIVYLDDYKYSGDGNYDTMYLDFRTKKDFAAYVRELGMKEPTRGSYLQIEGYRSPKRLSQFETMTWDEIRQQTHGGKGKSSSHNIDVDDLNPKAKERLKILKFDDRDKIYSLRLEGTVRIFGFKELNYLDIIWIDLNHEVCPSKKK